VNPLGMPSLLNVPCGLVSLLPAFCTRYFFLAGYGTSQLLIRTDQPSGSRLRVCCKAAKGPTPALVFFDPRNLSVPYR
jgi:hypothetical protein